MQILIEYDETISTKQHNNKNVDSFHNAIGSVILTGQLFGIMPVSGILSADTRYVSFKWFSIRSITSVLLTLFGIIEVLMVMLMLKENVSLGITGSLIFYGVCLFINVFFGRLAVHWPALIQLWRRNEDVFLKNPYKKLKRTLAFDVRIIAFAILFVSMMEHSLYIASGAYNTKIQIDECNLNISFFKSLYIREKRHLAKQIPYNHFAASLFFLNNVAMTFRWTFADVFIMTISIGLARRYDQINERLETARGQLMPESFWIEVRTHFLALTELLQCVDKYMSPLTLLSCASNLYFICCQLFNSFHHIPMLLNKIYFWVALTFIVTRTLVMLFCASSINDASKKPLKVLRCVPSVAWSVEVQRFTDQVTNEVIALSGKRFFFITRKLILAMAGTVATYELVLLDTIKNEQTPTHICDIRSLTYIISDE